MKIYDHNTAPNPRRVRVFLAEKGITVPFHEVASGENRTPAYLKMNPLGGFPVLELDDGTHIAESVAICRYFEELHPQPPLMGVEARDKAVVEMWQRRMEIEIFNNFAGALLNTHPMFKDRLKQVPEYGQVCKGNLLQRFEWLDRELANRLFVAGERYTIADITAQVALDAAGQTQVLTPPPHLKNLQRWHRSVSGRPSAKA